MFSFLLLRIVKLLLCRCRLIVMCKRPFRATREEMFSIGQRANAAHVLVLITDGMSDDRNATWFEAMLTRRSGIDIIVVSTTNIYAV